MVITERKEYKHLLADHEPAAGARHRHQRDNASGEELLRQRGEHLGDCSRTTRQASPATRPWLQLIVGRARLPPTLEHLHQGRTQNILKIIRERCAAALHQRRKPV
jgi:hypothetical protein